jgi:AbrB family looped-hinge helix DNA binding protein
MKECMMLVELKDKSQVTIPKAVVRQLGLKRGDMFDVVVHDGVVMMVPVVVYPRAKAEELEALAASARESAATGKADVYDDVEDLIADLHKAV